MTELKSLKRTIKVVKTNETFLHSIYIVRGNNRFKVRQQCCGIFAGILLVFKYDILYIKLA